MAIARFLDRMCLALRASRVWLRYATLQNWIPYFPWIAPPRPPPWRNQRKGNFAIWQPCSFSLSDASSPGPAPLSVLSTEIHLPASDGGVHGFVTEGRRGRGRKVVSEGDGCSESGRYRIQNGLKSTPLTRYLCCVLTQWKEIHISIVLLKAVGRLRESHVLFKVEA